MASSKLGAVLPPQSFIPGRLLTVAQPAEPEQIASSHNNSQLHPTTQPISIRTLIFGRGPHGRDLMRNFPLRSGVGFSPLPKSAILYIDHGQLKIGDSDLSTFMSKDQVQPSAPEPPVGTVDAVVDCGGTTQTNPQ
jgi:hypothetical protein